MTYVSLHTPPEGAPFNALSVTSPRLLDWFTLGFGYHVEHHLFPAMSGRHALTVREQLARIWPERYQSMRVSRALKRLYETGRVYKDATTLCDPRTDGEWPALMPGHPVPTGAQTTKHVVASRQVQV